MSKTVLCVLLKVLMLARADILSMDPYSDFIQNLTSDWSHPDNVSVRNNIDEISFTNMSVISESIDSTLSKPTSLRAFVEFYNGFLNKEDISVTFRWNQPEFTDELIQGYTVQCCFIENLKDIQICDDESISAKILQCTVHNLKPNTTYYVQVRAHTKIGAGPYTDIINVSTTHENPIPQLLITSRTGIDIWDLDLNTAVNLVKDVVAIYVTYSIAEHKIYWCDEYMIELKMLEMNENSITKIAKLQDIAYNLCIDWVARNLYWTEIDGNEYYIVKLDLTMWENGIVKYDKISETRTRVSYPSAFNILPLIGYINFRYEINKQSIDPREKSQ